MSGVTVETIRLIRVTTDGVGVVLIMEGLVEDVRIVTDLGGDIPRKLVRDLIAAGFGPEQRGDENAR